MLMSRFATPFMNGLLPSSLVRQGHLALSHWSFVLMGVHLGLHFGMVTAKLKNRAVKTAVGAVMTGVSVYGFYLFFKAGFFDYMLLKTPFAFLDYDKAWWLVLLENLAMLLAWAFAGFLLSLFIRLIIRKRKEKNSAVVYSVVGSRYSRCYCLKHSAQHPIGKSVRRVEYAVDSCPHIETYSHSKTAIPAIPSGVAFLFL